MKHVLLASAAALAFTLAASIAPVQAQSLDTKSAEVQNLMKDYFGNTRICHEDTLFECHMWLYPDGSFILIGFNRFSEAGSPNPALPAPHGLGFHIQHGTWTVEGKKGDYKLCRKMSTATRAGCEPEPGMKLGDTYVKYHDEGQLKGTTERYALVKGHV